MKDLLLITPPFTQLNTPYPATAYLKGFLNSKNIESFQIDLGIEVILELFSKKGLEELFKLSCKNEKEFSKNSSRIYSSRNSYVNTIEDVISFLQGKNKTLAKQICFNKYLPRASRFDNIKNLESSLKEMHIQDKAKYYATLYLEDISDFIVECVDSNFGFSRYAERLGRSANTFDELYDSLQKDITYIDTISLNILNDKIKGATPKLICFSVPFPGNLYSAFRCAQFIKTNYPDIKIAMGGGFPTTELRSINDPRVFVFFDFILMDDGELPLELLISNVLFFDVEKIYKRTFLREKGNVVYKDSSLRKDYKQIDLPSPDYSDLLLDRYISVIEIANPMHSLWNDRRWNKLTMAHGCYWGKCAFCDISLDYIKNFDSNDAKSLVDKIELLVKQTRETGFHFVDEAAPPKLMKEFALEILRRKLSITWWTNIRFEKSFTKDFCILLKASGCIAVSGGLEVASDRLLKLINKGVTVEQVAQVINNFTKAGIMVHAYLMYGFPSQTIQETIDSLEMVRQMFEQEIIQSGFWHQFALTAHSAVGLNPEKFGITPDIKEIKFANNDIQFTDKTGIDHSLFSFGLKKSIYNFMHGIGFDIPVQEWFGSENVTSKIPKTTIAKDFILKSIAIDDIFVVKASSKIVFLGKEPDVIHFSKSKKGQTWKKLKMIFHQITEDIEVILDQDKGEWLLESLKNLSIYEKDFIRFEQLKIDFEIQFSDFELFWYSKPIISLKEKGLLILI